MKKLFLPALIGLSAMTLFTGCIIGDRQHTTQIPPTTGQQLVDLQKAKDAGALTDAEYATQKEKILSKK